MDGVALTAVAFVATVLVAVYVALGGGSYKPLTVADPCNPRPVAAASGLDAVSEQVVLSALDGAACRLHVTREDLVLALGSTARRTRFARAHGITEPAFEDAIRAGLDRAAADAQRTGRLTPTEASILGTAAAALPIGSLISALQSGRGFAKAITGAVGG